MTEGGIAGGLNQSIRTGWLRDGDVIPPWRSGRVAVAASAIGNGVWRDGHGCKRSAIKLAVRLLAAIFLGALDRRLRALTPDAIDATTVDAKPRQPAFYLGFVSWETRRSRDRFVVSGGLGRCLTQNFSRSANSLMGRRLLRPCRRGRIHARNQTRGDANASLFLA
jgi:hypothetical protein